MKSQYYSDLLLWLRDYIKTKKLPFSADDVKEDYLKQNPKPSDERVFGNALQTLWREDLLKQHGEKKSSNKKAHGRKIKVWLTIEYSKRQSINRKANGENQTTLF